MIEFGEGEDRLMGIVPQARDCLFGAAETDETGQESLPVREA